MTQPQHDAPQPNPAQQITSIPNIQQMAVAAFWLPQVYVAETVNTFLIALGTVIPFFGGSIAQDLASRWQGWAQSHAQHAVRPIAQFVNAWVTVMVQRALTPIKKALWSLEGAVWRTQHIVIPQAVKYVLQTVDREAVAGYKALNGARRDMLQRLLGNPLIQGFVTRVLLSRLENMLLTVVTEGNPVERFLLGRLLSFALDRLGAARAAGDALHTLLGPMVGQGPPTGLSSVIARMCADTQANADWITDDGQPIVSALAADRAQGKAFLDIMTPVLAVLASGEALRDPGGTARLAEELFLPAMAAYGAASAALGDPTAAALAGFVGEGFRDPQGTARALTGVLRAL